MAAFSYDDYRAPDEGGTLAVVLNWGGAVLSLVLIAGLVTWGWQLWVRDVSGVPVVRALEGPMRVQPDEPGGLASDYQGLSVNQVAEDRVEPVASDAVVLAPAPTTLDESEDLAMADLPAVAPEPVSESALVPEALDETVVAVLDPPRDLIGTAESFTLEEVDEAQALAAIQEVLEEAQAIAVVEEQAAVSEPAPSATDIAVAAALADAGLRPVSTDLKIEAAANVPVITPRPLVRPVNLQRVSVPPRVAGSVPGEVDLASIPVGTRLVQLGAFGSAEVARAEWAAAEAAFGGVMSGKSRVIQQVQSSGQSFYRLRVMGFEGLSEARRFCAELVAQSANCIPVVHE